MPGLSIWQGVNATDNAFAQELESVRHFDRYRSETLEGLEHTRVGYTADPSYPIEIVDGETIRVIVEGRLYNRTLGETELLDLGASLLDESESAGIREWVRQTDGDFVLCAIDTESANVALANDLFGRLPVYHRQTSDGVRASREIQFLLPGERPVEADSIGVAQTLLFGYPLADRTLWRNITKLPPASILRIDGECRSVTQLVEFDFDAKRHQHRSVARNARELAGRFVTASRARSENDPTVVSLSGGHDSRAVAAALGLSETKSRAVTFARNGATTRDVRIAKDVAEALDIEWHRYDIPPTSATQARTLLDLKAGLNHVGMGFILGFFERLRETVGPGLTYLTGDGGDKALPDLRPSVQLSDLDDLVEYTISRNSVVAPSRAADLARVSRRELRASVRKVLASYPEQTLADKYVHFLIHERGFNWLFEGEDRNRYYSWTATPFYSTQFFRYAMNVPHGQKRHNRLYREFFAALWPPAMTFDDADLATPMGSARYDLVQRGLDVLERHPRLKSAVRSVYRGELFDGGDSSLKRLVQYQLDSLPRGHLPTNRGPSDAAPPANGSRHAQATILTVLAAMDVLETGRCVFDRHPDVAFR